MQQEIRGSSSGFSGNFLQYLLPKYETMGAKSMRIDFVPANFGISRGENRTIFRFHFLCRNSPQLFCVCDWKMITPEAITWEIFPLHFRICVGTETKK